MSSTIRFLSIDTALMSSTHGMELQRKPAGLNIGVFFVHANFRFLINFCLAIPPSICKRVRCQVQCSRYSKAIYHALTSRMRGAVSVTGAWVKVTVGHEYSSPQHS